MRRSRKSSAAEQARGNFTPPPQSATSPAGRSGAAAGGGDAGASGSRLAPRNWRVPTKLNAILLIPVIVGLVMGGFQVKSSITTWNGARDAEQVALVVGAASAYSEALLEERDNSAEPLLSSQRDNFNVKRAYSRTDEAAKAFDTAVKKLPKTKELQRRLQLFRAEEPSLATLRKTAYTAAMDPVKTEEGYVKVQHSLMEFSNELGLGTGNINSYGRTVYAIQLAQAAESLQRSIGTHLLVRPSQDPATFQAQVVAFNSYNYLEQIALQEYVSGGTEEDAAALKSEMAAQAVSAKNYVSRDRAAAKSEKKRYVNPPVKGGSMFDGIASEIGKGRTPAALKAKGIDSESWAIAAGTRFDGYSTVEKNLVENAVGDAATISHNAKNDAITNGAVVLVALLIAFILAGMMARQMSRAMRRLRTAAFGVAEQRLPMLVDQLSRTEPGRVDTRVEPIPIHTQDEIGEVARAFDQVHREAVRLASEQAMLRGNVNAIFTNLSRRNQSLIEGQLTLITDLENNEAEPEQLESLFKLDHLATRMRRNGENLLVLAGEEPGRRWNQPVPLVDVLRAASSEVESYERIELTGVPETEIHGQSVTDLVHLLAELLENATTFSSPQTRVRVTATRLPDGRVMIEIHDKGIGLTAEDFADINHKLANPPTVDAAISQRMGLFVVGRLADRHGVRVQLRPSGEQAGTTSLVMLPDAITHGGGGEQLPADDFSVSSIIPEQQPREQQSFPQAAQRTAAELGFDDTRYGDSEPRRLDPVNRSLMREERRAALDGTHDGSGRPLFRDEAPQPEQQYGQGGQHAQHGNGYAQQGNSSAQYGQEPQQAPYDQSGYAAPDGYRNGAYPDSGHPVSDGRQQPYDSAFEPQAHQDDWAGQATYQDGFRSAYQPEAESVQGAPAAAPERVGFDRPGPSPSTSHELTDAGLPRRGGQQAPKPDPGAHQPGQQNPGHPQAGQQNPEERNDGEESGESSRPDGWRSSNDERWQRADKLREPKAGGVTPSGLPRRVPKANLVEGKAEETPQGGPQVSRAPEDVRGRLSNLRRGVLRGRNEGSDTNGQATGNHHGGPDSTYNQER
ncbi:nitrate- and nitrite sensing domain-containing protein [Streptomyces sp. NBC_00963]|uniref:sensor histidine kinase n=1 Tax=unclassified Streptomyces TaxID=2593676 RepID=UPI00224FD257|nr:nitrate- and nitrite sensing domain-containing protein [Streptomyces sp. NBC_01306]MCX4723514.1 nitrate- and nitrite sensing domain-containing protein [Streptomyces sp. NBC_01306]WSX45004.1 nitrate- and nitrite sensing domain-containing protein [Streptomyces sp. NBC_00963]